jgi:hypothetical protein
VSRIRSIHPGLWTDEAFVTLSPMARLLLMGLWNECDDMGSFAWAPLTLKMRVLPADAADASELLAEMVSVGIVMRYDVAGKHYGAVRNFCQFQRPKKPNAVHPQTPDVEAWVNSQARIVRDGAEPVPNQLPTASEKPRQMEDGGGVMEEKGCSDEQPKARKRAVVGYEIPEWVPAEPWAAYVKMRKAHKAPFTDDAAKVNLRELEKLRDEGHDPDKVLMKAVSKGWRGVFGDDGTKPDRKALTPLEEIAQLERMIPRYESDGRPDYVRQAQSRIAELRGKPPDPAIAANANRIVKSAGSMMRSGRA